MKKKGFTLIELLAVIIILAIIALIATPIVLNVIEDAKNKANKNSAYGIIDGARLYYAESMLDITKQPDINGETNLINKIVISGDKPVSGSVYINNKGEIEVAIVYGKTCYTKIFAATDLIESDNIENCGGKPIVLTGTEIGKKVLERFPNLTLANTDVKGCAKDDNNYTYMGGCYLKGSQTNNYIWFSGFYTESWELIVMVV